MIYVDKSKIPHRNMLMSHLLADTTSELLEMVDKIGVKRKWIQKEGKPDEHFDICQLKKKEALKHGAIEVTSKKIVEIIRTKRSK